MSILLSMTICTYHKNDLFFSLFFSYRCKNDKKMSDLCIICFNREKNYMCCMYCNNYVCVKCSVNVGGYEIYIRWVCSIKCIMDNLRFNDWCRPYDLSNNKEIRNKIINDQQQRLNKVHANVITGIIDKYIIKDLHKIVIDFLMMTTTT